MRSRTDVLKTFATLLVGAWLGIGAQKVTEQHIGWLVYGLIGIPGIVLVAICAKRDWDEAARREKEEKRRLSQASKYPMIRP